VTTLMTETPATGTAAAVPVLLEIDEASWKGHLDRVARWLAHVVAAQAEFHTLAADAAAKVKEPHWHKYLTEVAEAAGRHQGKIEEMYRAIGREPSKVGERTGPVLAKAQEAMATLVGTTTGASAPWRDLQQLHLVSLGAISAFATAEQLGYAVGLTDLARIGLDVVTEKYKHHRMLQEAVLEFAAMAILYGSEIGEDDSKGAGVKDGHAT